MERGDHDARRRAGEVVGEPLVADDGQVEPVLGEDAGERWSPNPRPRRRRPRGSRRRAATGAAWRAPSPSPTAGAHPLVATTGVSGDSGAAVQRPRRSRSAVRGAARPAGGAGGRPRRRRSPHVRASERARSSSSASRSAARSRMRRGSTRITCAVVGQQVGDEALVVGQPRQPALHAVEDQRPRRGAPTARVPTARRRPARRPARGRRRLASSSRAGNDERLGQSARWSAGRVTENSVSRSTSSPHRSMRIGASAVDGKTSMIEPRRATSPRCSTSSSRR